MRLPLNTRFAYTIGRYLPFLKLQPPEMDRQAALTLRPGRNSLLTWEKRENGDTLLTVPIQEEANRIKRAVTKWLRVPNERQVELDEVGGFVWELCDGSNTIEAIVQKTRRQYKMNRREAEVSVTQFLQTLHQKNYIGFYKKVPKSSGKESRNERKSHIADPGTASEGAEPDPTAL